MDLLWFGRLDPDPIRIREGKKDRSEKLNNSCFVVLDVHFGAVLGIRDILVQIRIRRSD
jgi:hypothetical protein